MGKSRQHDMPKKRRPDVMPARKHAPRSPSLNVGAQPVDAPPLTALAKQHETIFTFLPDSAIVCDQKGKMLRINIAALELFKIHAETQWRGKNVQVFLEQYGMYDEQRRPFSSKQWITHSLIQQEVICSPPETYITLQVSSGRRVAVTLSCSPLYDARKQVSGMVIVFHEISQRFQQALHLQRVHEAVLTLARQPLASAVQSAQRQQRMINDIIDDAHIQANQLEVRLKRCNLLALLKTVVDTQQQMIPEHMLVLDRKTTAQEVFVLADAERVTQVFNTYLTNALTYSPEDAPVTVQLAVEDSVARVSVHNEGPGIPYEEQKHLWERFYRAKGYAVQHELDLSLGLGLYLCRAFIERQAGSVGIQSALGQGATFWFTLPIAPKEKE